MSRLYKRLSLVAVVTAVALCSIACAKVEIVDVPYVSGPSAPATVDLGITTDNFAGADSIYLQVRSYSSLGTDTGLAESVSASSVEQAVALSGCAAGCTVRVTWDASPEPGINRDGGGYRIYFSDTPDFTIK